MIKMPGHPNPIRLLIWIGLGALSCALTCRSYSFVENFSPPNNLLIVGFRETATHRPAPPPVPIANFEGMMDGVKLWLHVNNVGHVVEVHGLEASEAQIREVYSTALALQYAPFLRNGTPVDAWVQDKINFKAIERIPARIVPLTKISDPTHSSIRLSRSGCYGTCAAYSVTIRGDGMVTYKGRQYVSIPGVQTTHISPSDFNALLDRFKAANFLGFEESYVASVTDSPTYCLSVSIDGKIKTVKDYVGQWVGMPAAVTELEDAVDTVSDSDRWVSSSPQTVAAMKDAVIPANSPAGRNILRAAIEGGDKVTVQALLPDTGVENPVEKASHTNQETSPQGEHSGAGKSLLTLAVSYGYSMGPAARLEMVKLLVANEKLRTDHAGMQDALAGAAQVGDVELARFLIAAGADPKARFAADWSDADKSETYLMLASASGVWAMLEDALQRPHDIGAKDNLGHTALRNVAYHAEEQEDIFPLVDRLLAAGADRSDLDMILLEDCYPDWIAGLIARGANVNVRDAKGNTPLFENCTIGRVQLLLDAGADPTIRNNAGKTAIEATYIPEHGKEDPRAVLIRRYMRMAARKQ